MSRRGQAVAYPRRSASMWAFEMVSERPGHPLFASTGGYLGWCWGRPSPAYPREGASPPCEVDMTREGALLAPKWVPWERTCVPRTFLATMSPAVQSG